LPTKQRASRKGKLLRRETSKQTLFETLVVAQVENSSPIEEKAQIEEKGYT
jgi:hypothetical protein